MRKGTAEVIPIWEIPRSTRTKLAIQLLAMRRTPETEPVWGVDIRKYVLNLSPGAKTGREWVPFKGAVVYIQEIDELIEALGEAKKELTKRVNHATSETRD